MLGVGALRVRPALWECRAVPDTWLGSGTYFAREHWGSDFKPMEPRAGSSPVFGLRGVRSGRLKCVQGCGRDVLLFVCFFLAFCFSVWHLVAKYYIPRGYIAVRGVIFMEGSFGGSGGLAPRDAHNRCSRRSHSYGG
jgi:hypothetical protein